MNRRYSQIACLRREPVASVADFLHPLGYRASKAPASKGSAEIGAPLTRVLASLRKIAAGVVTAPCRFKVHQLWHCVTCQFMFRWLQAFVRRELVSDVPPEMELCLDCGKLMCSMRGANNGFLRGGRAGFFLTRADPISRSDVCRSESRGGRMLVGDNIALIRVDKAQALTQPPETAEGSEEFCLSASGEAVSAITDGFIALIESRTFIRECIRRSMQSAFPLQIHSYSEAIELQRKCHKLPKLILLSTIEDNKEANGNVFNFSLKSRPEYQSLFSPSKMTPQWPRPPFPMARKVSSQ